MSDERRPMSLSAAERSLIFGLREISEPEHRERVLTLVDGLVRIAREPGCAETQADGVPCGSVHSQCEDCARVSEKVQTLVAGSFPVRPTVPA